MESKALFVFRFCVIFIFLSISCVFGEEQYKEENKTIKEGVGETESFIGGIKIRTMAFDKEKPGETQWLWGEVKSADNQKGCLLVQFLDYDADQERELNICVDEKTVYENVKSFADIKQPDSVTIDYVISAEGKNIAKNISVEKPEISPQ